MANKKETISVSVRLEAEYLEMIYVLNALSGGVLTDADVIREALKEKFDRETKRDAAMAKELRNRASKHLAEKLKKK
jgi:hypothetical protein